MLAYISYASGVATLYDVRRATDYDAGQGVDVFVNRPDVKVSAAWPRWIDRWSGSDSGSGSDHTCAMQ